MEGVPQLVFLDTFKHPKPDDMHMDLVRFVNQQTVIIREIRVITGGKQVKINGTNCQPGYTFPSNINLEVFISNLKRPNNAAMQKVGNLCVRKGADNRFEPDVRVPTDAVAIKGVYGQLTLAIFGDLAIADHMITGDSAVQQLLPPLTTLLPPPPAPPVGTIVLPSSAANPPHHSHLLPPQPPPGTLGGMPPPPPGIVASMQSLPLAPPGTTGAPLSSFSGPGNTAQFNPYVPPPTVLVGHQPTNVVGSPMMGAPSSIASADPMLMHHHQHQQQHGFDTSRPPPHQQQPPMTITPVGRSQLAPITLSTGQLKPSPLQQHLSPPRTERSTLTPLPTSISRSSAAGHSNSSSEERGDRGGSRSVVGGGWSQSGGGGRKFGAGGISGSRSGDGSRGYGRNILLRDSSGGRRRPDAAAADSFHSKKFKASFASSNPSPPPPSSASAVPPRPAVTSPVVPAVPAHQEPEDLEVISEDELEYVGEELVSAEKKAFEAVSDDDDDDDDDNGLDEEEDQNNGIENVQERATTRREVVNGGAGVRSSSSASNGRPAASVLLDDVLNVPTTASHQDHLSAGGSESSSGGVLPTFVAAAPVSGGAAVTAAAVSGAKDSSNNGVRGGEDGEMYMKEEDVEMLDTAAGRFNPTTVQFTPLQYLREPWLSPNVEMKSLELNRAVTRAGLAVQTKMEAGMDLSSINLPPEMAHPVSPDESNPSGGCGDVVVGKTLRDYEQAAEMLGNAVQTWGSMYEENISEWLKGMKELEPRLEDALAFWFSQIGGERHGEHGKMETWRTLKLDDVCQALVSWTMFGLDMSEAKNHPEPGAIIRHIKVGIRMAIVLATANHRLNSALVNSEVQHLLIDLLIPEHTTQPIKLAVLSALHATLSYPDGFKDFVQQYRPAWQGGPELSPYQRLVKALKEQPIRVKYALNSIMNQVSMVESLMHVHGSCVKVLEQRGENEVVEDIEWTEGESSSIRSHLVNVGSFLADPDHFLGFPEYEVNKFQLPTTRVMKDRRPLRSPIPSMYYFMYHHNLVSSLNVLMSGVSVKWGFNRECHQIIETLCRSEAGVLFLKAQPTAANHLLQILLSQQTFEDGNEIWGVTGGLSVELATIAYAVNAVDTLQAAVPMDVNGDNDTVISGFRQLHVLCGTLLGRSVLAQIFTWSKNVLLLAAYLCPSAVTPAPGTSNNQHSESGGPTEPTASDNSEVFDPVLSGEPSSDAFLEPSLPPPRLGGIKKEGVDSVAGSSSMAAPSTTPAHTSVTDLLNSRKMKSVAASYANLFLLNTFQHSSCPLPFILSNAALFQSISAAAEGKNAEFPQWVEVVNKMGLTSKMGSTTVAQFSSLETVELLCNRVNNVTEELLKLPAASVAPSKELITALRILRHSTVPPKPMTSDHVFGSRQLSYSAAMIQLHFMNTDQSLVKLINALCDSQFINWQQGLDLNNMQGTLFFAAIIPSIQILNQLLKLLIDAQGNKFRDRTCVLGLVKVFSICCTMGPPPFVYSPDSRSVHKLVVSTLLCFTQPDIPRQEDNSNSNDGTKADKSLWVDMVSELLDAWESSPTYFAAVLTLLSELLPLPLPFQTLMQNIVSEDDRDVNIRRRAKWLAVFESPQWNGKERVGHLVATLSSSANPSIHHPFRRLIVQIADLSSGMSTTVVLSLMNEMNWPRLRDESRKTDGSDLEFTHRLSCLSYIASFAPIKMTIIHHLTQTQPPTTADSTSAKDQHGSMWTFFKQMMAFLPNDDKSTLAAQCKESIISIISHLTDVEIGLINPYPNSPLIITNMVRGEALSGICYALLTHIGGESSGYSTLIPTLRILLVLSDHDLGIVYIQSGLIKVSGEVYNPIFRKLICKLSQEFSEQSSDSLSTLSTTVELLKKLLRLPKSSSFAPWMIGGGAAAPGDSDSQSADVAGPARTMLIRGALLRRALDWKDGGRLPNAAHPLSEMEELLAKNNEEDPSLAEGVLEVIEMLSEDVTDESLFARDVDGMRDVEAVVDSIEVQFRERTVWQIMSDHVVEEEQYRLTPSYWFPPQTEFPLDDPDTSQLVTVNLEAIRTEFLPTYDPKAELLEKVSTKHVEKSRRKPTLKTPGIINTAKGEKRNNPPPLRGRGFNIGRGVGGPRGPQDHFRNRPQNTSRAPSMHVDDFLIMEHEAKGPPGSLSGSGGQKASDSSPGKNRGDGAGGGGNPRGMRSSDLPSGRPMPPPTRRRMTGGGMGGSGSRRGGGSTYPMSHHRRGAGGNQHHR